MNETMEANGSSSGVGGNSTAVVIDDRCPVPENEYPAAVRLIALLGSGDHFAGPDPRSAWMWVLRMPDCKHRALTFLVNHNRQPIHVFSAALTGDSALCGKQAHCDARQVIGRSAMVRVRHKALADGGVIPEIADALPLPDGVEPVVLDDACIWTPASRHDLPTWVPQWVRNYANTAVKRDWEMRHGKAAIQ